MLSFTCFGDERARESDFFRLQIVSDGAGIKNSAAALCGFGDIYVHNARSPSSLPASRADKYEADSSRELVPMLKRQGDWEGSLGENIDWMVSGFYL